MAGMTNTITRVLGLILAAAAGQGAAVENATEVAGATQPTPATEAAPMSAGLEWALSRGVYPEGIEDEEGYLRQIRAQRAVCVSRADASANPAQVVEYNLAAANLILARETEPFAARELLGLSRPEDAASMQSALAAARERLTAATAALDQWGEGEAAEAEQYRTALDLLQSFTAALEAVWSQDSDETAQTKRAGAVALAVLLEHPRQDVASAATLWQAVLYRQLGRLDKAFELLPRATARIEREARSYDFFSRLLRCRLVADRGGHAAACALLLQIEERVVEWFGTDAARAEAAHAALLVRAQMLEQWRAKLDPATQASEIDWCNRALERLQNSLAAEGEEVRVLRLEETIPVLVPLPDAPDFTPATQELGGQRTPG